MAYPVMSTTVPWSLVKSGFKKTPHFNTLTQKTAAGRRSSLIMQPYPTWDFELDLNYVLGGEGQQFSVLQSFLGLYIQTCGGGSFFLFTDPNDNTVDDTGSSGPAQSCMLNVTVGAASPMGVLGDGVSTQFQLARYIGAGVDIIQNVASPTFFVNGVAATGALGASGIVSFATAPANNAVLTWGGTFQYLCQFSEDTLKDLARVTKNTNGWLWSCTSIAFESVFV